MGNRMDQNPAASRCLQDAITEPAPQGLRTEASLLTTFDC